MAEFSKDQKARQSRQGLKARKFLTAKWTLTIWGKSKKAVRINLKIKTHPTTLGFQALQIAMFWSARNKIYSQRGLIQCRMSSQKNSLVSTSFVEATRTWTHLPLTWTTSWLITSKSSWLDSITWNQLPKSKVKAPLSYSKSSRQSHHRSTLKK